MISCLTVSTETAPLPYISGDDSSVLKGIPENQSEEYKNADHQNSSNYLIVLYQGQPFIQGWSQFWEALLYSRKFKDCIVKI